MTVLELQRDVLTLQRSNLLLKQELLKLKAQDESHSSLSRNNLSFKRREHKQEKHHNFVYNSFTSYSHDR